MAKKISKQEESTTITTRIDVVAKNIIKRSERSYREILEDEAYSSISSQHDDIINASKKEMDELKDDISEISHTMDLNDSRIRKLQEDINKLKEHNKRLNKRLSSKQERLSEIQNGIQTLDQLVEDYEDNITYGITDAVTKVEETLKHNDDLRKLGPRARVKESEIKRICAEYKVTVEEVLSKVDSKYLDCMDGYQKYV